MSGIQILLITGVLIIFLYFIMRFRNALVDLALLFIFSGLAVFFILIPDYTNRIAHKLGVGRGADLLFYLCILFFLFVILKLFARIRRLENMLTDIVRRDAISGVRDMSVPDSDETKKKTH
jgi:small membrane protein